MIPMKTNVLLFSLVSFGFTVLPSFASAPVENPESVQVLPAYAVEAPRQTPGEKSIQAQLDALRAVSTKPVAIEVALPALDGKKIVIKPEQKTPANDVIVAGL